MGAKRHRHRFHALWWNFGSFGRQDVHVHDCTVAARGSDQMDCDRVLIGQGRDCDGEPASHYRETLNGGDDVPA